MSFPPPEIFKAYDIRGVVGKSLTREGVRLIGQALGSELLERSSGTGRPEIAVGRDGRISGPELARALMEGIRASGVDVAEIGMFATPVAYFAAHELGCGSAVAVTGSHNPPEYNGLKMVLAGTTLAGEEVQGLRRRIESGQLARGAGRHRRADIREAYLNRIAADVRLARPMKIAVDCGNGVAGATAGELYRRLGGVPSLWKTGHSLIKARMRERGAALAGEMSGHTFFVERWYGFDDAQYAGARLLEILSKTPDATAALNSLPDSVSTPELHLPLTEGEPHRLIEALGKNASFPGATEVIRLDGLRVEYPDGFGLARASNTTPVIVLRFEAEDEEGLDRIESEFRRVLLSARPDAKLPF